MARKKAVGTAEGGPSRKRKRNAAADGGHGVVQALFSVSSTKQRSRKKRKDSVCPPSLLKVAAEHAPSFPNLLRELDRPFKPMQKLITEKITEEFEFMHQALRTGFNILLFGPGSKRSLLQDFATQQLDSAQDAAVLEVNPWLEPVSAKKVLLAAIAAVEGPDSRSTSTRWTSPESLLSTLTALTSPPTPAPVPPPASKARASRKGSAGRPPAAAPQPPPPPHVYILINCIDAPCLRDKAAGELLSRAAAIPNVHFVASSWHANVAQLFSSQQAGRFNWLWYHAPTYEPLQGEGLALEPVLAAGQRAETRLNARVVLDMLTQASRGVFQTLGRGLLDDVLGDGGEEAMGVTMDHLFRLCRERMLVSSDAVLKRHLVEFQDHGLVKTRRGPEGEDLVYVPLTAGELEDLMAELEAAGDGGQG